MSLLEDDMKYIWHPAQQMKDAEVFPPVVIDHGKGCYLYDIEGKEYIDIISSWWCNLLGHCNDEINDAIKDQLGQLEHVMPQFLPSSALAHNKGVAAAAAKRADAFQFHR